MKFTRILATALVISLSPLPAPAQTPAGEEQVKQLRDELQKMQQQFIEQQRLFQQQMKSMQQRIESLRRDQSTVATGQVELKEMMEHKLSDPATGVAHVERKPWHPTDPIRVTGDDSKYVNISFDGLMTLGTSTASDVAVLQPGGHDPNQRGFTLQQAEVSFDGAVDHYFRGMADIIFLINNAGETVVELEESYLETLSLPGNLELRAGQFFTEFGQHNRTHPHVWGFVDMPLINNRMFGGDGQRAPGARLAWGAPTSFPSKLFLGLQNGNGATMPSFRSSYDGAAAFGRLHTNTRADRALAPRDFVFSPRYEAEFELTESQLLTAGVSGSFGANASGPNNDSQIYGVDLTWRWRPHDDHDSDDGDDADHAAEEQHAHDDDSADERGFPFVIWQTEAMMRRYEAGAYTDDLAAGRDLFNTGVVDTAPAETIRDYGFYSQILYGFRPGWVAGIRGDYVAPNRAEYERLFGVDAARDRRWRISPNLTHYPTDFSKVRLQYNYDWRDNRGPDHSLWLQFEFVLGAHDAHDH